MGNLVSTGYMETRLPSGNYVGNGTEITIELGFCPNMVKIYSDDNSFITRKFTDGPTHGMGRMNFGDSKNHRGIKLNSGGIVFTETGLTVGSNSAVNTADKTYYWEAR